MTEITISSWAIGLALIILLVILDVLFIATVSGINDREV